jgi:gas vesicle protein
MKLRNKRSLLNVLLGAGLLLLDPLRQNVADGVDDLKDRAQDLRDRARDQYDTASDRVSRASDVIRGDDHSTLNSAFAFMAGIGVGACVGLLLAPASGEETRSTIAEKVHDFGGQVRDRFSSETRKATGT